MCLHLKIWSLMDLSNVFNRYIHMLLKASFVRGLLAISGQQEVYQDLGYAAISWTHLWQKKVA